MTAIQQDPRNKKVMVFGQITTFVEAGAHENAHSWIKAGTDVFLLEFNRDVNIPESLEGRHAKVFGKISSGYEGDVIIKVSDYEITTHLGTPNKNRPKGWKAEWPIRKDAK